MTRSVLVVTAMLTLASCGKIDRPRYGGDQEAALTRAAVAGDLTTVNTLLASHADPNVMVELNGRSQSAWYVALDQIRPEQPATIAIVAAMLKSGADPNAAWGTGDSAVTRPTRSRWEQFWSGSRVQSTTTRSPLDVAMRHPSLDAMRLLLGTHFDRRLGENVLVDAIASGQDEIARMLVDAGVDANCRPGAITPLIAAVEARNLDMITYLETHGAREKP